MSVTDLLCVNIFCSRRLRAGKRQPGRRQPMTSSQYLQSSIALQTRNLQMERGKLQALKAIASELACIKTMMAAQNGFQFVEIPNELPNEP